MPKRLPDEELARRRTLILQSSRGVFLRHGFAKTTMEDLARAADISRPALYLIFSDKTIIFDAVINCLWQETLRTFQMGVAKLKTTEQKLRFCLRYWTGSGYDLTVASPDAADAFNLKYPAVRSMYDSLALYLGSVIREDVRSPILKFSPEELASAAVFSLRGMKELAKNRQHLLELIDLEVDLVLSLLSSSSAPSSGKERSHRLGGAKVS